MTPETRQFKLHISLSLDLSKTLLEICCNKTGDSVAIKEEKVSVPQKIVDETVGIAINRAVSYAFFQFRSYWSSKNPLIRIYFLHKVSLGYCGRYRLWTIPLASFDEISSTIMVEKPISCISQLDINLRF
jgi:hypothetical protein